MAGIKAADIMVPHQKLAQNLYTEVEKTTALAAAEPVKTGPEPILAMPLELTLALVRNCPRNVQPVMYLKLVVKIKRASVRYRESANGSADGYAYSDALAGFGTKDYQH